MTRYIAQRVFQALIVLLLVTLITFSILHALPGGAARSALGLDATQAQIDAYNHQMGYDQPLWKQYFGYLIQIFHGEFGHSFRLNMPVADAIGQRLPKTIVLSLMSAVVAILLAIPIGAIQAVKRNRTADYALTVIAMLAYSTPLFFLGLVLIILFSQVWPIFPPEAPQGFSVGEVLSQGRSLVLPTTTLAIVMPAVYARYMRSSMIDNLEENYIRTARSKGITETRVVIVHALRNSLFPIITLLGMQLPALFSGALVVESLFNYPGMGLLFWQAAQFRDYPILLAVTIIISMATVLSALIADILYAVVDPRIRYGGADR